MAIENAKIVDRVRKLLALATSPNVHEAERAAALAARLMARHQIGEALVSDEGAAPEPVTEETVETQRRLVRWKSILLGGVARSAGCAFYISRGRADVEYRIVGRATNLGAVHYLFGYLRRQMDALVAAETVRLRREGGAPPGARDWQASYRAGVAQTIAQRLVAERQQAFAAARADATETQALVRLDREEEAIKEFMARLRLRMMRRPELSSLSAYDRGRIAGQDVSLGGRSAGGLGRGARLIGSG